MKSAIIESRDNNELMKKISIKNPIDVSDLIKIVKDASSWNYDPLFWNCQDFVKYVDKKV
jgi:hypothetical protein